MEHQEYINMYEAEESYWWFIGKRAYLTTIFHRFIHRMNNKILDVGCGTGGTSSFLSRWGTVVGIEPNPLARKYVRKRNIQVLAGSANRLPVGTGTQDVVTVLDVLYHKGVIQKRALKEAYRALKSGGTLIVTDCAYAWLWSRHDERMHARKRYTKQELVQAIQASNFRVVYGSYLFFSSFPVFAMHRIMQKVFGIGKTSFPRIPSVINEWMKVAVSVESWLLGYVRFPWGSSIVVVAQKI